MDASIFLTFSNLQGQDSHEFEWKVCDSPIARRWFIEMDHSLRLENNLREQRFIGWNHSAEDQKNRVERLNAAVSIINTYYQDRYHIKERASLNMSQDVLNALHHHFELLMGQSWNRSTLTQGIPYNVLVQVRLLNDLVHDYEAADRAQAAEDAGEGVPRSLHCQLVPYRQLPLTEEDLALFSYSHEWGDLFSNYCQLGKNWSEVFHDQDEHIHPENIAPLRFYASSFGAYFYTHTEEASQNLKKQVKDFIRSLAQATRENVDPDDVRHALGHVVFAKLSPQSVLFQMPERERNEFIKKRTNITAIRVQSELGNFKRDFPNPDDYFGL